MSFIKLRWSTIYLFLICFYIVPDLGKKCTNSRIFAGFVTPSYYSIMQDLSLRDLRHLIQERGEIKEHLHQFLCSLT